MYDRTLWKYKTTLKNSVDLSSDNYSISNKRNLYNNLMKLNIKSIEKHLMKQYKLNLYDMFKGKNNFKKYKYLFNKNKIWILKPVFGMGGGMDIKIMENYNQLVSHISKVTTKNQYKWRNMNYKKYEKIRDIVKY